MLLDMQITHMKTFSVHIYTEVCLEEQTLTKICFVGKKHFWQVLADACSIKNVPDVTCIKPY